MPYGKDYFLSFHFSRKKTIQLSLGPVLREEVVTEDNDSISRTGQAALDGVTQTIADLQCELIEPDV